MYTAEEQAKHRKQWVDALRSGQYTQNKHKLRTNDAYCCLGVACEISQLGIWTISTDTNYKSADKHFTYNTKNDELASVLPVEVMNWLGVRDSTVTLKTKLNLRETGLYGKGFYSEQWAATLITLNDCGVHFDSISDIIESDAIILANNNT